MKHDQFLEKAYADKNFDYYDCPRPEMMAMIPTSCARLLDVGCGGGAFGQAVKARLKSEVWGVEPEPKSAKLAESRIDRVFEGLFTEDLDLPKDYFDCIVFNDVLEHILDPGQALVFAKTLLRKGGVVVSSIPNIGHFPTVFRLAIHGEFEYAERGILDKTHLRFFTRKSIRKMYETAGYRVDSLEGINPFYEMIPADGRLWKYYKIVKLLPYPGVKDMRYLQFATRAAKE